MSIVTDFKSIRRKVERLEQKVEFDVNNPPPPAWYSNPVVWTPEHGYGQGQPVSDEDRLALYQMYGLGYQGEDEPAADVTASSPVWDSVSYLYDSDRKEVFAVAKGESVRIDNFGRFKDWAEYKADPETEV